MEFNNKSGIIKQADEMLSLEDPEILVLLRSYNSWYTKSIEFVEIHAKERREEFIQLHFENQNNLTGRSNKPDYDKFKKSLIIQVGIIEGSRDRTWHISATVI
jgi:hypothetical protein